MLFKPLAFALAASLPFCAKGAPVGGETAAADDLLAFLTTADQAPKSLQYSIELFEKDEDSINGLLTSTSNVVMFLPTNEAWDDDEELYELLDNDSSAELRSALLEALTVETSGFEDWEDVVKHAEASGGRLDTAYGSHLLFQKNEKVCVSNYVKGEYKKGDCGEIETPGIRLKNALVFPIDDVLVPKDLIARLDAAKPGIADELD